METYYPPIDHAVPDVSGLSWPFPFPRPQPIKINGVLLVGDKSSEELGLASAEDMKKVQQKVSGMGDQITRAVEAAQTATQTANEAKEAAEGKADADDLPYALVVVEARVSARLPDGVTVWTYVNGTKGDDVTGNAVISKDTPGQLTLEVKGGSYEGYIAVWLSDGTDGSYNEDPEYMGYCLCDIDGTVLGGNDLPDLILQGPTLANRAINQYTPTGSETSITLTLPETIGGHSRNLYVRIDMTNWSGAEVPTVTFQNADGTLAVTEAKGGNWPSLVAGNDNIISLKEVAEGVFTIEATEYLLMKPPTP